MTPHPAPGSPAPTLCELAALGRLAAEAGASPRRAADLRREALPIVWPLVFQHHTRPLERRLGHLGCLRSMGDMAAVCHDRFLDEVLAVVDYTLAYAKTPVANLEGWVSTRIAPAIVDGHRRRRGRLGAQQRPRVPKWLAAALDDDPWLVELARRILEWAGVGAQAGGERWPTEAWAEARAAATGEWNRAGDVRAVERDVERVSSTMRRLRPDWYERYVERPLDAAQDLVLRLSSELQTVPNADWTGADHRLVELADVTLDRIDRRTSAGVDLAMAVATTVREVFLDGCAPGQVPVGYGDDPCGGDEVVAAVLGDPERIAQLTAAVRTIIGDRAAARPFGPPSAPRRRVA